MTASFFEHELSEVSGELSVDEDMKQEEDVWEKQQSSNGE